MIEPWRRISTKLLGDFRVFSLHEDRKVSPRTGAEHNFFIIHSPSWVNVIALTPDRQLVMIEQYRQGSNTVELELPGGVMDAADPSPEAAACRELAEETGYRGEEPRIVGKVFPNPAIMSNSCFTVLLRDCRYATPVRFDAGEDMATKLVPLGQVPDLVASGQIRHALMVAALYQFELWRQNSGS